MRCARPTPPRTTRAMARFGSSLSPPVTSLAPRPPPPVAEPASKPAGKQQPCCTSKSPRLTAGGSFLCNPKNSGRPAEVPCSHTLRGETLQLGLDSCGPQKTNPFRFRQTPSRDSSLQPVFVMQPPRSDVATTRQFSGTPRRG